MTLPIIITIISTVLIFIFPIYLEIKNNIGYTHGMSVDIGVRIGGICAILVFICLLLNRSKIKQTKFIPILMFLITMAIAVIIQRLYPELLLISFVQTFLTVLMYFTIENPDLQMLERLNILKLEAESSNEAKNEFLKRMRHEINTPIGQAQVFNEENLRIGKEINNNEIITNAKYIDTLINNIHDISINAITIAKLETNELEIEPIAYKSENLFDRIDSLTKSLIMSKESDNDIKFKMQIDSKMPVVLTGDYDKVLQIIYNLISNAVKYTNNGEIILKAKANVKNNICALTISVIDTGIGIKKEDLNKLFNKLERIDFENNQGIARGIGLGLTISKKLVELMNGKMEVSSTYGKGSTFTFTIDQETIGGVK
jgi:signal transduction histidine kinase